MRLSLVFHFGTWELIPTYKKITQNVETDKKRTVCEFTFLFLSFGYISKVK